MALSDVMFEAIKDIEGYQTNGYYEGLERELEVVKTVMLSLQVSLDLPPAPPYEPHIARLQESLRKLDISGLEAALEAVRNRKPE